MFIIKLSLMQLLLCVIIGAMKMCHMLTTMCLFYNKDYLNKFMLPRIQYTRKRNVDTNTWFDPSSIPIRCMISLAQSYKASRGYLARACVGVYLYVRVFMSEMGAFQCEYF